MAGLDGDFVFNTKVALSFLFLCYCILQLTDGEEIRRCIEEASSRIALGWSVSGSRSILCNPFNLGPLESVLLLQCPD